MARADEMIEQVPEPDGDGLTAHWNLEFSTLAEIQEGW